MAVHATQWQPANLQMTMPGFILVLGWSLKMVDHILAPLTRAGFGVDFMQIGDTDLINHIREPAALIVLDLGDDAAEALNLITALRCAGVDTPVIIIAGSVSDALARQMFAVGADAILPASIESSELTARCRALVRRPVSSSVADVGSLHIDAAARTVSVGGRTLDLSVKQYLLLEQLARRAGQVATRQLLVDYLYGGIDPPDVGMIDFFIHAIRRQLDAARSVTRIETVRGAGYRLVA